MLGVWITTGAGAGTGFEDVGFGTGAGEGACFLRVVCGVGDDAGAGAVCKLSAKEEAMLLTTSPAVENPTIPRIMRRGIMKSGMFLCIVSLFPF